MKKWCAIKGFENYEVSDDGLVRNKKTKRILKEAIKYKRSHFGYAYVFLYSNGKRKMLMVHRIVAIAFIPNPLNLPQINHKDENSLNNNVANLEWCDAKYNMNYGTYKERLRKRMLENNPFKNKHHSLETKQKMRNKKLGLPSKRKRKVIIDGVEFDSVTDAMKTLNLSTRAIYRKLRKDR